MITTATTSTKLRILQVLHSPGYGGAEIHALMLMRALKNRGHEVCYAGRADSWLGRECERHGILVQHIRMRGMFDLFSYLKLAKVIRSWKPDVVHAHLARASQYTGVAARLSLWKNMQMVCSAHSTKANNHFRAFKHIIAVSNAVRTNLVAHGYPEANVHMIYNGVPDAYSSHEQLQQLRVTKRKELGIPNNRIALVCAGRFVFDKGQDIAIAAIDALRQTASDMHLYLIGDHNTEYGHRVMELSAKSTRVHFLGYRNDVSQLLPAFDCYVAPSRREALSLSLLEAASAGLPTIAANVGGIPEAVADKQTGILFPVDDPGSMAAAITDLFERDGLAAHYGKQARQRFETLFTLERMVDSMLALYCKRPATAMHKSLRRDQRKPQKLQE